MNENKLEDSKGFAALLRLVRPKQWIKNGFIFLPLFFGGANFFANRIIKLDTEHFCYQNIARPATRFAVPPGRRTGAAVFYMKKTPPKGPPATSIHQSITEQLNKKMQSKCNSKRKEPQNH